MIWGTFSWFEMCNMAAKRSSQKSLTYVRVLEDGQIFFFAKNEFTLKWIFQQDEKAINANKIVESRLVVDKVHVMKWASKSPNHNWIEIFWSWPSRKVYDSRRNFETVEDLQKYAMRRWATMQIPVISKHVDSMPKRAIEVLETSGEHTNYYVYCRVIVSELYPSDHWGRILLITPDYL